ncbi:MAG TPA: MBOAT family protein [Acidimicrobiia bacterium]|nr:MBOAT family protein [Acidimicrobiia bacterium]
MTFNSFQFFVFLPVVLGTYWLLRRRHHQNLLLLVASYVFYGWWDYRFLSLLAISTVADFTIGQAMNRTESDRIRRRWLFASLGVNLGILGFFKYFNFFVDSAVSVLNSLGLSAHAPTLSIVLPVGISFYSFQTLSYAFDVYRRRLPAERNIITFGLYVAFFPQLVAGPIERAQRLLPQFQAERHRPSPMEVWSGSWLILIGLFKKIVLADGLAMVVQDRFTDPTGHGALSLLLGVYAFSIQIYGDFSGYSSIARGTSRLFGIELMRNFEQPYLSTNITQFWRTWHISLSTWLMDYLYIPLGGSQRGRRRTYINLMLTMLLGGLWHGAAWTFVVWGGLHGLYLATHRAFGAYEPRGRPPAPGARDVWKLIANFHLVGFAWIFFRADTFKQAWDYVIGFGRLGDLASPDGLPLASVAALVALMMSGSFALDWVDRNRAAFEPLVRWSVVPLGAAAGVMVASILVFGGGVPTPFIYFQF